MVNPVIKDGTLILVGSTLGGNADCCCEVTNPCTGFADCTGHAGSAGVAPSIALTMFDADYAGASRTWCGVVWTQQNIKDGVTKCACPSTYRLIDTPVLGPPTLPVYGNSGNNRESWEGTAGSNLFLFRSMSWYSIFPMVVTHYYKIRQMIVQLNYAGQAFGDSRSSRQDTLRFSGGTTVSNSINTQQDFPILNPGISPSNVSVNAVAADFHILPEQFGDFTDPSGLNWKWEKGANW